MKMTKIALWIVVGLISLAASKTMAVDIDGTKLIQAVQIANGEPKYRQCLDFNPPPLNKGSDHGYDVPAELVPCTIERPNQLWILHPDGSIQSLTGNLCLIYDPYVNQKNPATVKDCDKSSDEAKKWKIWRDGTITHVATPRYVLTASFAVPHPFVNVEQNTYAPSQSWKILYVYV